MYELIPPEGIVAPEERCLVFNKNLTKLKEEVCKKVTPSIKSDISGESN